MVNSLPHPSSTKNAEPLLCLLGKGVGLLECQGVTDSGVWLVQHSERAPALAGVPSQPWSWAWSRDASWHEAQRADYLRTMVFPQSNCLLVGNTGLVGTVESPGCLSNEHRTGSETRLGSTFKHKWETPWSPLVALESSELMVHVHLRLSIRWS